MSKTWSPLQTAIFNLIEDPNGAITCLIDSMPEIERTIPALLNTIDSLFSDKKNAVVLATIHKSKGLEADRVFWLGRNECPRQVGSSGLAEATRSQSVLCRSNPRQASALHHRAASLGL